MQKYTAAWNAAIVGLFGVLVVGSVSLSAGEARAEFVDGPVTCQGLGIGACVPMEKDLFEVSGPFIVSDTDAGGDPLFAIFAGEAEIILVFEELVTGRDLEQVGFQLTNVESAQDLAVGNITDICSTQEQTNCVFFINWRNPPISRPEVTNDGGIQTIEWPLFTGGDPRTGSIVIIRPSAELVNGPVTCEGRGIGACTPMQKDLFDVSPPYTVFDTDVGGDPLFAIFAEEAEISLDFTDLVTAIDLEEVGFQLIGLESTPDLAVGEITDECTSPEQTNCVSFLNWNAKPTSRPVVTNDGGVQTIEWALFTGGDPQLDSIATIRPSFASEPPPVVSATKAAALIDDLTGDGAASVGDTLRYTIEVTNDGDSDALGALVFDEPDSSAPLVAGSVTTSQGNVNAGNTAGDEVVEVDLGTLPTGAIATVTFDAAVAPGSIENAASVSGQNFDPLATNVTSNPVSDGGAAACFEDLASCEQGRGTCQSDLGTCQGDLAQCQGDFSALTADEDGDGLFDQFDRCPGTPGGEAIDAAGCSIAQFCEAAGGGKPKLCLFADWQNNEPGRPKDCKPSQGTCRPR